MEQIITAVDAPLTKEEALEAIIGLRSRAEGILECIEHLQASMRMDAELRM